MNSREQARVKAVLDAYTKKATQSAKTARETLVKEGIYQKNGRLSPNYSQERKSA